MTDKISNDGLGIENKYRFCHFKKSGLVELPEIQPWIDPFIGLNNFIPTGFFSCSCCIASKDRC